LKAVCPREVNAKIAGIMVISVATASGRRSAADCLLVFSFPSCTWERFATEGPQLRA
jgi:hypothetical protein